VSLRGLLRSPLATLLLASGLFVFFLARSVDPSYAIYTDTENLRLRFKAGSWGGCVRSIGYWKNHPEAWPAGEISIGGVISSKEDAITILETPPKGDATYMLAHQLIAAKLNVAGGADGPAINEIIQEADAWLVAHPLGSDPEDEVREEGIGFAEGLESYNVGESGSPGCQDEFADDVEDDTPDAGNDESSGEDLPNGEETEAEGPQCALVLDVDYWRTHADSWPTDSITAGGISYSSSDAAALMSQATEGDLIHELLRQLIGAKLKQLVARADDDVAKILEAADGWLVAYPVGSAPEADVYESGLDIAASLEAYNEAQVEPDECALDEDISGASSDENQGLESSIEESGESAEPQVGATPSAEVEDPQATPES